MKLARYLGATALAGISITASHGAMAQTTQSAAQSSTTADCTADPTLAGCANANTNAAPGDAIVVTGSRISRPNLGSTVPIVTIPGDEFFKSGNTSIGDRLNELPALQSTFSQANSTRFLGTAGLNLLDLRGLGTQRTLVLVDGRRHVAGDILNTGTSPDTNTFPTDLIERVDIVTGGNSAVYGSDAVAGVVNFILKRNFDGLQVRAQSGLSIDYQDAGAQFVSLLGGRNFAEGRGNIALNLEFAHQSQYFASGRPFERQDAFLVVQTDPPGAVNGSDGIPDRQFFTDIRSATFNNTGLVRIFGNPTLNCGTDVNRTAFNCPLAFAPDGTLAPVTGTRVGIGPNGSFIGGNGENFRGGNQYQLTPLLNRYNANLIAHFEFSPAFDVFGEAKYARTEVSGTGSSGPAFITGTALGDLRERPRLDNPYLSTGVSANLSALFAQSVAAGINPNTGSRYTTSGAQAAAAAQIAAGTFRLYLRENLLNLGARTEKSIRETYRGVIGVRGTFNDDWKYEVSANYGEFKERTRVLGNLNIQRFLLAADAVRNPAGQIVCNAQINPAAALPYNNTGDESLLAADVAGCTPINLFGGQFTPAQRNYVLQDTTSVGKITQFVANANLSGDTSQFLNLPGGPVAFNVGGEYRRETNYFKADPLVEQGYTFYNALPTFTAPAFEVKEAFGEIRVPILKDQLVHELSVSAAGRVSKYKGAIGTTYAYNYGIDFAPIKDIRFRAAYARSVRAPNLSELYSAAGQNFAPNFVDPCAADQIATGSANRVANCRTAGIPTSYNFVYSQSLEIVSGGNPNLQAEKGDSWTFGGVLQPRFIPNLSLSVDYYNIRISNSISSVDAQTIANQCYDQATLSNPFCALFQRAGASGGPRGELPFQILEGSLLASSLNFAKLQARGIDAQLTYRNQIGNIGRLSARAVYNHVIQRDDFLNPAEPNFADRLLYELGSPRDEFTVNLDLKTGPVTFGYRLRFIGKQLLNAYEDYYGVQDRPPQNADYATLKFYPRVFYHNLRLDFDATNQFNIYAGVDNITNKLPPYGLTGIGVGSGNGGGSGIYDARGRFGYVGVQAKF